MKRWIVIGLLGAIVLLATFSLAVTAGELNKVQVQIRTLEGNVAATTSELSQVKSELTSVDIKLSSLKSENEKLRVGDNYRLRDPYYKEVMDFLAADLTNTKQYIKGEYGLDHFARDVINAAKEKGVRCAFVDVAFPGGGLFSLVAFQTVDTGLVFIDPMTDRELKVAKGGKLWKDNFIAVAFDDTIVDILFYW